MARLALALACALLLAPLPAFAQKKGASSAAPAPTPTVEVVATTTGPVVLKHTPPEKAERGRELLLRAAIVAPAGAYLPTLYYRPQGESRFYSLPLLAVPGSVNLYAAAIPGIFVTKDIEYYLESYDTQLRGPGQYGNQKGPVKLPVGDPELPPSHVTVRSEPTEAHLFVDGKEIGSTPFRGPMSVGVHEIVLKKRGFLETATAVEVPPGQNTDLRLTLTPEAEAAQFAVMSDPSGATVFIDGQQLGVTPLLAPSPDGQHTLLVEKKGYARAERSVLLSKERSIEISFNLQKLPPEPALAIITEPPGAAVTVDDKPLGKTPFIGVVPSGEHTLLLTLDGRRTQQAQIVMPEDRDLDLRFTLEEETVKRPPVLAVSSDPAGAKVFLDGQEVGNTPYINLLPPGAHKIKLAYPNFYPYERKLQMPDDHDVEVTLALIPEPPPPGPSRVTIGSEPVGVEVFVDEKSAGKTPLSVELMPGQHVATAAKSGYRPVEERFSVVQGQSMQLKLALQPAPKEVKAEEPLVSITTDPEGALVLVDGKTLGNSPVQATLKPGKHKLTLTLEGYKTREELVDLPKTSAEIRLRYQLNAVRKSVQLMSAAEQKKEAEKPKEERERPVIALDTVKSADGATVAKQKLEDEAMRKALEQSRKELAEALAQAKKAQAEAESHGGDAPRMTGPLVLAGAGVLALVGSVVYGVQSVQTAADIADPLVLNRDELNGLHTTQIRASLGLAGLGVGLAAGGAVWAAIARGSATAPAKPPVDVALTPGGGGEVRVSGSF